MVPVQRPIKGPGRQQPGCGCFGDSGLRIDIFPPSCKVLVMATSSQRSATDSRQLWHRLFGLLLTAHLEDTPFVVELEKDLSVKQQLLDVLIVRRGPGEVVTQLPDGLTDLADYNLITFKSHQEALDDWALKELTGHYVNYRKQVSPRNKLLPERSFRLYAVCARYPRELFSTVSPEPIQAGVYACRRGSDAIRIVVAADLPKNERNAMLHLFSAAPEQVKYGAEHYRLRSVKTSRIINALFKGYQTEGLTMPYTMEEFLHEQALKLLPELTPEERLAGLRPEERLAGLRPEERLAGLRPEEIEAYLKRLRKKPGGPKQSRERRKK
jgi:hypothetical protein